MKNITPAPGDPGSDEKLEIVSNTGALEAITRGEIDMQIATAHKYPRNITLFNERALAMATMDQEVAESCIYVRPVGKEKNPDTGKWEQKYAEGLSIRAAEIVGASWGNLRVGAMIIEQTPERVTCRGFAHDLETNFASTSEVVEVTLKADGTPYSARQAAVVAKAALSKARRDATFQVVPRSMFKSIENEVRKMIAGDSKSFDQRKAAVMQWVQRLGIDAARVWANLGIEGPADLTPAHLLTLTGLRTSIKDKDVTVDEAFPPIAQTGTVGTQKPPAPQKTATEDAAGAGAKAAALAATTPPVATETPKPEGTPAGEAPKPAAQAPAETPKEPEPPKKEKPAPKGPNADALRKQILAKIGPHNIGKNRLMQELKGMTPPMLPADAIWDQIDAATLNTIDDIIDDVIERIVNPGALEST